MLYANSLTNSLIFAAPRYEQEIRFPKFSFTPTESDITYRQVSGKFIMLKTNSIISFLEFSSTKTLSQSGVVTSTLTRRICLEHKENPDGMLEVIRSLST